MTDKIIQTYVFFKGQAWFVSTIERDYDTCEGRTRGTETMAWEWSSETRKLGDILFTNEDGVDGHLRVCRQLAIDGTTGDTQ